ncbi:hypothetical protein BCR34DRAFT_92037 [Clohesyomyces aquaticus]|uniref:Uncharacterized protein n=1 Tax=Clohesyomyces aquaticus TaxID=1231657 RepID=A0A1Y1YUT8_9PLEO|nr:hypothetical protein BCR34DRAFT_92037 [Clohesyomyces aquaticus]
MTDLLRVLPDFDTRPHSHLLPSLEKALVATNDLLTVESADIARRAQVPAADLRRLVDAVVGALHRNLGFGLEEGVGAASLSRSGSQHVLHGERSNISTLDEKLDAALGGGIPPGYLVEVTGERYAAIRRLLDRNPATSNMIQSTVLLHTLRVSRVYMQRANSSQRCRQNPAASDAPVGLPTPTPPWPVQACCIHLDRSAFSDNSSDSAALYPSPPRLAGTQRETVTLENIEHTNA